MEEPEFATVTLRIPLLDTVGDFKEAVAEEAQKLFINDKKLDNDSDKLVDVGVGSESFVTNSPISKSNKMFFGPLTSNSFMKFVYGILSVVRIPRIQEDPNKSHILFSLPNRPGLEAILNKLDVLSFVRFISTCKWLHTFSISNTSLRVHFEATIDVERVWNFVRGDHLRFNFHFYDRFGERNLSSIQLKNLQKLPLELFAELNLRRISPFTSTTLTTVSEYINKFRKIQITFFNMDSEVEVNCWPEVIDFIESHSIKNVSLGCSNTMTDQQFESILLMDLEFLEIEGHVSRDLYRRLRMDGLFLRQSGLTVDEFKEILQLLAEDKIKNRRGWFFENIQGDFLVPDSFEKCFEQMHNLPFDYEGDLPETRPIISDAIIRHEQTEIYLLSRCNKVFSIHFENNRDNIYIDGEYDEWILYEGPEMFRRYAE